jgi:hypothetical protein
MPLVHELEINVDFILVSLNRAVVGCAAYVSEIYAVSIFTVKMSVYIDLCPSDQKVARLDHSSGEWEGDEGGIY